MSGVDTVRGINYQHCQAILTALDVAADDAVLGIRVEGTVDALDLEVIAEGPSGAGPVVVRGLQMKSRQQPHMCARAELLAIVHRWAELPVSADSESHSLPTASSGRPGTQSLLRWTRLETASTTSSRSYWGSTSPTPCAL